MVVIRDKLTFRAMRCSLLKVLPLMLLTFGSIASTQYALAADTKVVVTYEAVTPVSMDGTKYRSWSLFLVCNPEWLATEKVADLDDLFRTFEHFGAAIGDDNLAIWFRKSNFHRTKVAVNVRDTVDLERSSKFCKAWRLPPSRGPYVVVTTEYPGNDLVDEVKTIWLDPKIESPSKLRDGNAVLELGNLKPVEIHRLLARITDDLIQQGKVSAPQAQPRQVKKPAGGLVGFMVAIQRCMNDFGCALRFRISAGAVEADLQPCHTEVG